MGRFLSDPRIVLVSHIFMQEIPLFPCYSLESMKEIDRFFDEQSSETGLLSKNRGEILFGLASYIGDSAIKLYGGEWNTDDSDPQGEIHISVKLANGTVIWPVIRCMKRYEHGSEESIYAYLFVLNS